MIRIRGVGDWASVVALREAVREVPGELEVCWGTLQEHPGALNGMRRVNGFDQLVLFRGAGVRCPNATDRLDTAVQWALLGGVGSVWGRKLKHSKGRDIVPFGERGWDGSEYWVMRVEEVRREWRFHVFQGRSIKRERKVFRTNPWLRGPIRTDEVWTIDYRTEPAAAMREAARRAVEVVGYDFGAVDVLEDVDGVPWVLEVNRAPWLGESTLRAYVEAIARAARTGGRSV